MFFRYREQWQWGILYAICAQYTSNKMTKHRRYRILYHHHFFYFLAQQRAFELPYVRRHFVVCAITLERKSILTSNSAPTLELPVKSLLSKIG